MSIPSLSFSSTSFSSRFTSSSSSTWLYTSWTRHYNIVKYLIYFRENELVYIRREIDETEQPEQPEQTQENDTITHYIPPPPPLVIENSTPPVSITSPRIRRENIINLLEINRSLRRNIAEVINVTEREVFTPQREIPRSPIRQPSQNVRPFSLNLFSNR